MAPPTTIKHIQCLFVLLLTIHVSVSWEITECSRSESLSPECLCRKNSNTGQASFQCSNLDTSQLEKDFSQVFSSGESFFQLEIRDSHLEKIEGFPENFHTISNLKLENVHISSERLTSILNPLDELQHLMLNGGHITTLTKAHLSTQWKLEELDLNNNQMENIDENAFEAVAGTLKKLSLRGNKFNSIPPAVYKLTNLQDLDLGNNPITKVSAEDTTFLKEKGVNLYMNSLDCSCEASKSPFMAHIRDKQMEEVECGSPEKLRTNVAYKQSDEHFCGKGSTIVASLSLLTLTLLNV